MSRIISVLVAFLVGCSTSPAPVSAQREMAVLLAHEPIVRWQVSQAVKAAFLANDLDLALQGQMALCNDSAKKGGSPIDCQYAADLALIVQSPEFENAKAMSLLLAESSLSSEQRGNNSKSMLIENAILDGNLAAFICFDPQSKIELRATHCYYHGKETGDEQALNEALALFGQLKWLHKKADTYFVLAKTIQATNPGKAKVYASYAAIILQQLNELDKASFVRQWRQKELL